MDVDEKNDSKEVTGAALSNDDEIPINSNDDNQNEESEFRVTINGWISKVGIGVGRSDNDRQYIFCNKRPVDFPKLNKILNETWRKYEMKQKPAFIIDLRVSKGNVDVNVTPDKREIILKNDMIVLEKLKNIVDELYSPSRNCFLVNHPVITTFLKESPVVREKSSSIGDSVNTNQSEEQAISMETGIFSSSSQSSTLSFQENSQKERNADTIKSFISSPILKLSQENDVLPEVPSTEKSEEVTSLVFSQDKKTVWSSPLEQQRYVTSSKSSKSLSFPSFSSGNKWKSSFSSNSITRSEPSSSQSLFFTNNSFVQQKLQFSDIRRVSKEELQDISSTVQLKQQEDELNDKSLPINLAEQADAREESPVLIENKNIDIRLSQWNICTEEILRQFNSQMNSNERKLKRSVDDSISNSENHDLERLEREVAFNIQKETYRTIRKEVWSLILLSTLTYSNLTLRTFLKCRFLVSLTLALSLHD